MEQEALDKLAASSIQLIQLNQHSRGGYAACPLFPTYTYCWLRDGTFIAYAMDLAGAASSSGMFYAWVHEIMLRKQDQVHGLIRKHQEGQRIEHTEFLHTRYHVDGRDDEQSDWGHFQLDGYGAWLWGLVQHIRITGKRELLDEYRVSIELTVAYLRTFWLYPNFDCWEEYPDYVHTSTLACIYGGLHALGELEARQELLDSAAEIQRFVLEHAVLEARFVKSLQHRDGQWTAVKPGVDASLLWLLLPFGLVEKEHPYMLNTIRTIETELKHGGIQRYAEDSYYGGGEWLLLTAWYGWIQAELGFFDEARRCLAWIAAHADALGRFPEQVPEAMRIPQAYDDWVRRAGEPAKPLLWSHAMFLVLYGKLRQV